MITVVMAVLCLLIQVMLLYLPLRQNAQRAAKALDEAEHIENKRKLELKRTYSDLTIATWSSPTKSPLQSPAQKRGWFTEESSSSKYLAPPDKTSDDDQQIVCDNQEDEAEVQVEEDVNACCDEEVVSTVSMLLAFALVVIFVFVTVLWTVVVSTHHKTAVEDLMQQLANSTDTALGTSLVDAQKMVKQATSVWDLTGAPITNLVSISAWATRVLDAYSSSSGLGALRFATTTGLEQSVNSTYFNGSFNGIRVLSREFYESADAGVCLKEYLEDATTPSTTLGFSPDNCNYDPR